MHKNNKGFAPHLFCNLKRFLTTKCRFESPKGAGFTFIELITAAVILAIVVAGVYASFLSSAKLAGSFRHEAMAASGSETYLEQTRAANKFQNLEATFTQPDVSSWRLNSEVANLNATSTVTSGVNLGCSNTAYNFKRINTTVTWDERNI